MHSLHAITKAGRKRTGETGPGLRRSLAILLLPLLATLVLNARQPVEYEVKAAFLLNFAKFVEWPARTFPDANTPLVIGIMGDDPFGDTLPQLVQGQTAQGRRIEIRHFRAEDDPGACHLLFLSRSVAGQTREILQRLQDRPLITVGEHDGFVRQGGVIGFTLVNKSVRFDMNTRTAETAELKISSKLVALARFVVK